MVRGDEVSSKRQLSSARNLANNAFFSDPEARKPLTGSKKTQVSLSCLVNNRIFLVFSEKKWRRRSLFSGAMEGSPPLLTWADENVGTVAQLDGTLNYLHRKNDVDMPMQQSTTVTHKDEAEETLQEERYLVFELTTLCMEICTAQGRVISGISEKGLCLPRI